MSSKKCDLIIVEPSFNNREPTTLHMINVVNGDYLAPKFIAGRKTVVAQVLEIIETIKVNKPDKVIFERFGFGQTFYETFIYIVRQDRCLEIDSFGTVRYAD